MNGTQLRELLVEHGVPLEDTLAKLTFLGLQIGVRVKDAMFLWMTADVKNAKFDAYQFCTDILENRDRELAKIKEGERHGG